VTLSFFRLRKFSIIILLNRLSVPSVCNSSHSSIPLIHRFCLFMKFQISCMFHTYFCNIFSWSFTSWSNFILCLLFLILYFQIAPLCSVSLWLWYLFGILCAYFGGFQGFYILLISSFISWTVCLVLFIHLYFLWAHWTVYSCSLWGQILTSVFLLWGHLLFSGIHYLIALPQHRCSFYIAYIVFLYNFKIPSKSNKTSTKNKRDSKREEIKLFLFADDMIYI
jgi:hypothetical protein